MLATILSRITFVSVFLLIPAHLQCPQTQSVKTKRAKYNELLKQITNPEKVGYLTFNGQRFIPDFLPRFLTFYLENPTSYLPRKGLLKLIEKVENFYRKQKESLPYNTYILTNPGAQLFEIDGCDISETVQLAQAFCLSILMLKTLICISALYEGKTTDDAFKALEKIETNEAARYDTYNEYPGLIHFTYEVILNHLTETTASSTDASSDEEASA